MQYSILGLALVAAVTAQGVPKPIFPNGEDGPPTKGTNFPNNAFVLGTQPVGETQSTDGVYDCDSPTYSGAPRIALIGSALIDERGSTGSIVANDQFQFDGPPQNGVKVSAGWVRQSNSRLSLGGDDIFYNCLSGDFSNIYRDTQGEQCKQVYITLQTCTAGSKGDVNYEAVKKDGTDQYQIPKVNNDDSIQDDPTKPNLGSSVSGAYVSASSSSTSSSESSSTATSSEASSSATESASATTLSTSTAAATSSIAAPPMEMLPPQTQAVNSTVPAATGSPSTPASTTSSVASSPSPFTNAAPAIAVGQEAVALLAVVAAAFAFA